MDQAAPAHQGLLRAIRERGEDTDLDRHFGLRARRDRAEASRNRTRSLHFITDPQRLPLEKLPLERALSGADYTSTMADNRNQLQLFNF
jgi:hypothetical protein